MALDGNILGSAILTNTSIYIAGLGSIGSFNTISYWQIVGSTIVAHIATHGSVQVAGVSAGGDTVWGVIS